MKENGYHYKKNTQRFFRYILWDAGWKDGYCYIFAIFVISFK